MVPHAVKNRLFQKKTHIFYIFVATENEWIAQRVSNISQKYIYSYSLQPVLGKLLLKVMHYNIALLPKKYLI